MMCLDEISRPTRAQLQGWKITVGDKQSFGTTVNRQKHFLRTRHRYLPARVGLVNPELSPSPRRAYSVSLTLTRMLNPGNQKGRISLKTRSTKPWVCRSEMMIGRRVNGPLIWGPDSWLMGPSLVFTWFSPNQDLGYQGTPRGSYAIFPALRRGQTRFWICSRHVGCGSVVCGFCWARSSLAMDGLDMTLSAAKC